MNNGVVTAYFEKPPTRYWLDGSGKIGAEYAKQEIMHNTQKIIFDYAKLETIVSEVRTDQELADRLKIGKSTVDLKKREDAQFRAAYDRGKAKRKGQTTREILARSEQVFSSPIQAAKSIVDEIIEETESVAEFEENIPGADFSASDEVENQAITRHGGKRDGAGRKPHTEISRVTETAKTIQTQTLTEERILEIAKSYLPENRKVIPLTNGGEIEIIIRANFFELTREERELFDVLTDLDKSPP